MEDVEQATGENNKLRITMFFNKTNFSEFKLDLLRGWLNYFY